MSNQISFNLPKYYIYKLYFKSGKTYIGQHTQRKKNDKYVTSSTYYKRHKEDDPLEKREIILEVKDLETLNIMETICIMQDKAENGKQNVNGNLGGYVSWKIMEWTPERRKKVSEAHKGKKVSEETRKKLSERNKGKKLQDSTRRKISEKAKGRVSPMKGKKRSEQYKEKMSLFWKNYYKTHEGTNKGKKLNLSDEQRENLRKRASGKKWSEEARRKMSENRKGKKLGPMTESHKKKVGEASHASFLNSEKKRKGLNHKGHKHWTNGKEHKFQKDCPGEGWYEGFPVNTKRPSKKVKIIETGKIFRTQRDCAAFLNVSSTTVKLAIRYNRMIAKKYHVVLA